MGRLVLPPGFRFHPTDEELLGHYLRRKICGRRLDFEAIAEIDLYKYEPWDLPEKSIIQTRDKEWYFFIPRDRKYANGSRTNRATEKGYWKSTGRDRSVSSSSRAVGTKKTLVYYIGRAPKGQRTDWVMHEYRLNEVECERIHAPENGFVLCRIYEKSGPGPRNGEQYGAPVEDDDFDELPTVEGNGSGSFKSGLSQGPSSITVQSPASDDHETSHGLDTFSSGLQPRNLDTLFEGSCGDSHQGGTQIFTQSAIGGFPIPANGEVVESVVVAPAHHEKDHELLQELYQLVTSSASADKLDSGAAYQDPFWPSKDVFNQVGASFPSDGDFLELDDLISVSDSEEGSNIGKSNRKSVITGSRGYPGESLSPSLQASPMFDTNGEWQVQLFGEEACEVQQMMTPKDTQVQPSMSTVTHDSQWQEPRNNTQESSPLPSAGHSGLAEPGCEEIWKFIEHLNECVNENKSVHLEGSSEDIHQGLLQSERNYATPLQDNQQYYDAMVSFTDIDTCVEGANTDLQASYGHEISQINFPEASLASNTDEAVITAVHPNGVLELGDLITENNGLLQGELDPLEEGRRPQSPLSLIWSCLDSLPTLPASAADLSPKGASSGSISVTATGVGVGAVSFTCTCIGEGVPSSCMNCSVAEVENKDMILKSPNFLGQQTKASGRWHVVHFTSAVFVGLWAVLLMFIAGGAWKLFRGVYKLMIAGER